MRGCSVVALVDRGDVDVDLDVDCFVIRRGPDQTDLKKNPLGGQDF